MKHKLLLLLLFTLSWGIFQTKAQSTPEPFFKEGERVNFVGNSITHGGYFHNYLLLFYATRFPNQKVVFYNSGIWGDNANSFLQRMDADILSKPAEYAVVMAGMNDVNRSLYDPARQNEADIETKKARALTDYKGYYEQVIQKLLAANLKVILQKPTIYDETGTLPAPNMPGVNGALQKATVIIDELAQKYNLKTVDYYTILNTINAQLQATNPAATIVSNDRIHPGAPGHLVMAYQFLKETNAPRYVSKTVIENGAVKECANCTARDVNMAMGKVEFKVKANSLPYPVASDAAPALAWVPFIREFNEEFLQVSPLSPGKYTLLIDGTVASEFTHEQLQAGVNLATIQNTPQYKQALQVQGQTSLYRTVQIKVRDLKRVEFSYLPRDLLGKPYSEIEAYINQLISTNDVKYTANKALFDSYLVNKPQEQALEQQLTDLADQIYVLNKPVEHTYQILRSFQTQTHIWDFDSPIVNNTIQGWTIVNYSPATTENGILKLFGTRANNLIRYDAPVGSIDPAVSKVAVIRLKNETIHNKARFYWWSSNPTHDAAFIEFDISANDTDFKEYIIDLSRDPRWAGGIKIIRFDIPASLSASEYTKQISVDNVRLYTFPDMPDRTPAPFGVNLAGAEFGSNMPGVVNTDYTYPTIPELDYFKSKGLTLIRLPFKWERIQLTLGGALDQAELGRMKKFVEAARVRGIWVLLDMHNYGRRKINGTEYIIGAPELTIAHVADAWGKLAAEFKDYGNIWGYGLMNEPHDMLASTPWKNIAQALITKIREVDTQTTIVVAGDSWSSAARWQTASDNLKTLSDPSKKLMFEAHQYFDRDASGSYAGTYDTEGTTPTTGVERVTPFVAWLKQNNFKGFVGEYGVPDDDPRWLVTLDNMLNYLSVNCVNGTYWAAGPWWNTYKLAVEPRGGVDRPQLPTLQKYQFASNNCSTLTGIKEDLEASKKYVLFPNPSRHELFLDTPNFNGGQVTITDLLGRTVLNGTVKERTIDVKALPAGTYLLVVVKKEQRLYKRFIKE
ncbi:cellulase family glycosylhydrolase [Rufibacter ruber]|uniref:cellulase family glycosylhydrolase n=1 Tax=Rufibacter ruber TaxID=1783499 RepID=UPI0009EEFC46|nr:cellulase family glycosylhydrolase [Rufibacter ruber]